MRKGIELIILLAVVVCLAMLNRKLEEQVVSDMVEEQQYTVVLDAGHGGNDPGKVGEENILEKDINLALVKKLEKKLQEEKVHVVLTRDQDEMLSEDGRKKAEDMRRRVEIINAQKPQLAVSIHQNSYPDPTVCGSQVFYYPSSEKSEQAAGKVQNALCAVDETNSREIKKNDVYYLLRKTAVPMIIVECGFLSNPQEARRLNQEDYQEKLADAICRGIVDYLYSV